MRMAKGKVKPSGSSALTYRGAQHTASEETDIDSGLSLPHMPMHIHFPGAGENAASEYPDASDSCLGLYGDKSNIALLMLLYVLQGIPLGLAGSIPYLLQSRQVTYTEQAMFSFAYWPFSIKLLWAPIVDSTYFASFGRRKSWLVPTQYLIGFFMFTLSGYVGELLGEDSGSSSKEGHGVLTLTIVFFFLNFLAATQDIAVDGWALTMLSRRNVGWASTCNTVGQTAGYFMGNVVFLALESADFCNAYVRSEPQNTGLVTLSGFLYFWSIVFFVTTTLVALLKQEKPETYKEQSILQTYKQLYTIMRLPAVISLVTILLTSKIGFAAADAVTGLKLIEEGVPKEKLALLGIPMVPVQILLPLIISRHLTGPNPLDIFLKAMPFRLLMGLVFMAIVWWAPSTKSDTGTYPFYFFLVILVVYALHQVTLYCMFSSQMAFHAKISDPAIGGTYMTLLNTVSNLGGNWPTTLALWMVDGLTWKTCHPGTISCDTTTQVEACSSAGGTCTTSIDGYYVESVACFLIGCLWLMWRSWKVKKLQRLSASNWACPSLRS